MNGKNNSNNKTVEQNPEVSALHNEGVLYLRPGTRNTRWSARRAGQDDRYGGRVLTFKETESKGGFLENQSFFDLQPISFLRSGFMCSCLLL